MRRNSAEIIVLLSILAATHQISLQKRDKTRWIMRSELWRIQIYTPCRGFNWLSVWYSTMKISFHMHRAKQFSVEDWSSGIRCPAPCRPNVYMHPRNTNSKVDIIDSDFLVEWVSSVCSRIDGRIQKQCGEHANWPERSTPTSCRVFDVARPATPWKAGTFDCPLPLRLSFRLVS